MENQSPSNELLSEIKFLKEENTKLKEDISLLKVDKQMKDFKLQFLEQKLGLQDEQIKTLKSILKDQKKSENLPEKKIQNQNPVTNNTKNQVQKSEAPLKLEFNKDLTTNAPNYSAVTQMFSVFKSIKNKTYLTWVTKNKTIEIYDLDSENLIRTIENAHTNDIYCCRHFIDNKKNIDYLITSSYDKSIKIWNLESLDNKPLLTISNAHSNGYIYTPCILSHKNLEKNYIISGADEDYIKIFDFEGKSQNKDIKVDTYINFLDTFYDEKSNEFYIIVGNGKDVRSLKFNDCSIFNIYGENDSSSHPHVILYKQENIVKLVESNLKGYVHIWNFHTGECLNTIFLQTVLSGICLWDYNFLICACNDKELKIVNINDGKIEKGLPGHNRVCLSVQKIKLSKYGECVISHAKDGLLKLWTLKN